MSFYVDGSGYQQGAPAAGFAYGTFPQPAANQPVQVMDASGGYSSGSANGMYDAQWQLTAGGRYQMPMGVVPGAPMGPNYQTLGGPMVQAPNVGYRMPRQAGYTNAVRGHRGGFTAQFSRNVQVQGPKPIKATEIKSYLYAWCTQKKLKPEYNYEAQGRSPKVRYICTLTIAGIDHIAKEEARSKREAQTLAAWNFADAMVLKGVIKKNELPARNMSLEGVKAETATGGTGGATGAPPTGGEETESGGWNIDNARQRLNRFCMSERISCDFGNRVESHPDGTKMTHSKLQLDVKRLGGEPIVIAAKASNKKQANAQCAVIAVRKLFSIGVIEKHGEPPKKPVEPMGITNLAKQQQQPQGVKRKLDDPLEFDENGNWTLETARAKLQDYFASIGKDLQFIEKEVGTNQDRHYQYTVVLTVDSQSFAAAAVATNKKSAQKKCALDMVIQLYKANLIEGNTGKRIKPRQGPTAAKKVKTSGSIVHGGPKIMPMARIMIPNWGPGRTTPFDDKHLKAKLELLEQTQEEKNACGEMLIDVESMLKTCSEKIGAAQQDEDKPLQEAIRIGCFPKGTMLKGERDLSIIIITQHKTTIKVMTEVYCCLREHELSAKFSHISHNYEEAQITLSRVFGDVTLTLGLCFSSEKLSESVSDPDPVDILPSKKCFEYLSELRQSQFFQTFAHPMVNAVPVARILKSVIQDDPSWNQLSEWGCDLLLQKTMESAGHPQTAGDIIRRFFAILSSGVLLPGGVGLADPTNDNDDLVADLSKQEREDISGKAQYALRLISFSQIHKLLDIKKIEKNKQEVKGEVPSSEEMTPTE